MSHETQLIILKRIEEIDNMGITKSLTLGKLNKLLQERNQLYAELSRYYQLMLNENIK